MIKIMQISNMEKFIEKIQMCHGDVFLNLPDGTECNLKTDHTALQMIKMLHSANEELPLRLTDARDYVIMMNFMMHAAA